MRDAYATKVEPLRSCEEVSFFKLTDLVWKGKKCPAHPLHRFFTLMRKMKARSYVSEELALNEELIEERDMATKRCGGTANIDKATRFTFFGSKPRSEDWQDEEHLKGKHILGYAVVVTLELPNKSLRTFLLEAIIRSPAICFETADGKEDVVLIDVPNYYVHNSRDFTVSLGTAEQDNRDFVIPGTFFTQQNDLTSVCSHAALRIIVNSSARMQKPLLDITGNDTLTNKYINDVLELDFEGSRKTVGHYEDDPKDIRCKEGLTSADMTNVVESLGMRFSVSNFLDRISVDYDECMYPMVESLCPTILEVQGWNMRRREQYAHALAVMGHTLNSDRWEPEANIGYGNYPPRKYIPVCQWICHYVISDDNYGMNMTLPSDTVRNDRVPHKNPGAHAVRTMSIVPEEITITGYASQKIAVDIANAHIEKTKLSPKIYWLEKLKEKAKNKNIVCRTVLVSDEAYRDYIQNVVETEQVKLRKKQRAYFNDLPQYVWVTEITLPNLYVGNKRKLADVVIDACASEAEIRERDCVLLAWFPGFIRRGIHPPTECWAITKHVPLIRCGARAPLIEW